MRFQVGSWAIGLVVLAAFSSAAFPQAAGARAAGAACSVVAYPIAGRLSSAGTLRGPGLVLSGSGLLGMPNREVLRWIRTQLAPGSGRSGNLLVLQAAEGNDYSQAFYRESSFAAVREVFVPPCAARQKVDAVADYVDRADAVLFAGGDQAHYVAWKASLLIRAVRRLYARGGVVGGGSAGLAIQGAVVYDAVAADRLLKDNLDSRRAALDPYDAALSLTSGLFAWPPLAATITDSHFARRDRFGRLAAFMARAFNDGLVGKDLLYGDRVYGLGVDEGSALLVDGYGVATLREASGTPYRTQGAYVLSGSQAARITPGRPLLYTVDVVHLQHPGDTYDLVHHRGAGTHYRVTVDGAHPNLYSRNPYR